MAGSGRQCGTCPTSASTVSCTGMQQGLGVMLLACTRSYTSRTRAQSTSNLPCLLTFQQCHATLTPSLPASPRPAGSPASPAPPGWQPSSRCAGGGRRGGLEPAMHACPATHRPQWSGCPLQEQHGEAARPWTWPHDLLSQTHALLIRACLISFKQSWHAATPFLMLLLPSSCSPAALPIARRQERHTAPAASISAKVTLRSAAATGS